MCIAPRHPKRTNEVSKILKKFNLTYTFDSEEKNYKNGNFEFFFLNNYYCTNGLSRHILTSNMNFESPNTLVFIIYKEFVQKIFQSTKIGKIMSRIFFYSNPFSFFLLKMSKDFFVCDIFSTFLISFSRLMWAPHYRKNAKNSKNQSPWLEMSLNKNLPKK